MKTICHYLFLISLLFLCTNCNESDDVEAIFTGKTWKLNFIAREGEGHMYDFWKNKDAHDKSIKLLNTANTFTVSFDGKAEDDLIQGKLSGTTITSRFEGGWSANAKDHQFQTKIASGKDDGDILAKNFLAGLKAAHAYEGDTNSLYLIYKTPTGTFRMFFRAVHK